MHRLRTVTSLDVSAVAGHHAMPAALLFYVMGKAMSDELSCKGTGLFQDIIVWLALKHYHVIQLRQELLCIDSY